MKVLNVLIIGQIGSGKTTFAKRLLALSPRAFVFDPLEEYEDGSIYYDFREAVSFYRENRRADFHLIWRGENPLAVKAWLDILYKTQREEQLPALALFMDESTLFSSSYDIGSELEAVYTRGRKAYINVVSIMQRDTQVNPLLRANSQVWVSLRQANVSQSSREMYRRDQLDRIQTLQDLKPPKYGGSKPTRGIHFETYPPDFDVETSWARHVILRP